jgi:hypothetical protein
MKTFSEKIKFWVNRNGFVFLFFLCFCSIFFLQYPIQHSLVGDIDTIYNLALYHQMKNFIDFHLFGVPSGLLCAPSEIPFQEQAWINFGANYGIGVVHILFNYFGCSDLWAHWLFMSLLFALNCFALFLFLKLLFDNVWVCIAVSLFFNFAHFTLGNLDNINSVVFFLSYLALYFYLKYANSLKSKPLTKYFYWAVCLGAIQIYLSPYNFVIHTLIWVVFIAFFELKKLQWSNIKRFTIGFFIYSAIIFPYLYVFFISDLVSREFNVYSTENFIHVQSLNFDDLWRVLKNHLYLKSELVLESPLLSKLRACYLGVAFYLLAIIGLFRKQNRALGVSLVILGIIISVGPYVSYQNIRLYPSFIMHPLYEFLDLYDKISVPIRFFFIAVLGLSILAGNGLILILKHKKGTMLSIFFSLLVLFENIPLKMEVYNHRFLLNMDKEFTHLLKNQDLQLIYHMPSSLVEMNANYRREYIYMYWQHFHRQNVVNGFPPFMPGNRKAIDNELVNFNSNTLKATMERNKINKIIYHKDLAYNNLEKTQLDSLYNFSYLKPIFKTEKLIVFEFDQTKRSDD